MPKPRFTPREGVLINAQEEYGDSFLFFNDFQTRKRIQPLGLSHFIVHFRNDYVCFERFSITAPRRVL